jgi:predicted RNA binding protein YcfA (HicA-like mRNA interferase family)
MKVKEILKLLEENGWYVARTKGSHRQLKHSDKSGTVTLSGKTEHRHTAGHLTAS